MTLSCIAEPWLGVDNDVNVITDMIVSETIQHSSDAESDESPTGRRSRRPPRTAETRMRLVEAGRTLFAAQGPHAVTSHAIAAHAGFAAGTFYLHFKDKQALFLELAENAASELEDRLQRVATEQSDPVEIMRSQAEALVGFAEEQRDLIRIIFHPGGEAASIGSGILERLASGVSERRREALADGRAMDCFENNVLAQAVVGMWAHVLAWWAEDPNRASRESIVQTLTHFQVHGNRAAPGATCRLPVTLSPTSTARTTAPEGAKTK